MDTEETEADTTQPNPIVMQRTKLLLELEHYKMEPVVAIKESPLQWWKDECKLYPILGRFAKMRLGVQATSVAAKRVFSSAGDIVSDKRARLSSEHVDMLLFLKKNYVL